MDSMDTMEAIVIWDPLGKLPEGSVVQAVARAGLVSRGVLLLPYNRENVRNPVSGVFSRKWGPGAEFNQAHAKRDCPMLVYIEPHHRHLRWCARLMPTSKGAKPSGLMRLVAYTGVLGASAGGLQTSSNCVDLGKLGDIDEFGGWSISDGHQVAVNVEGYLALTLYGSCSGVKVMQSAISVF